MPAPRTALASMCLLATALACAATSLGSNSAPAAVLGERVYRNVQALFGRKAPPEARPTPRADDRWQALAHQMSIVFDNTAPPQARLTPRADDWWQEWHNQMKSDIAKADDGQGFELLFYGDSITQQWNISCRDVWEYFFDRAFRSEVLAISGDQTGHLAWRIMNGELPTVVAPRVAVLLIGTNDLGAARNAWGDLRIAEAVPGIVRRVQFIVDYLRVYQPGMQLLLLGLLPRGWAQAERRYAQPSPYSVPIALLNQAYREMAERDRQVHFLDCGAAYVATPDGAIDSDLMPDALHPSHTGMILMARCLQPHVEQLMNASRAQQQAGSAAAPGAPRLRVAAGSRAHAAAPYQQ